MGDNGVLMKDYYERARIERAEAIYKIVDRLSNPPSKSELKKIEELIGYGTDLEVRFNEGNKETVLHIALTREYTDAALLLLKYGADMNARCIQEITPFIWAAMKGNNDVLSAMFDSGRAPPPDRDSYDALGEGRLTALMCAARSGHKNTAFELIRRGADIHLKNDMGKSAYDFAVDKSIPLALDMEALHNHLAGKKAVEGLVNGTDSAMKPMRPLQLKKGLP